MIFGGGLDLEKIKGKNEQVKISISCAFYMCVAIRVVTQIQDFQDTIRKLQIRIRSTTRLASSVTTLIQLLS